VNSRGHQPTGTRPQTLYDPFRVEQSSGIPIPRVSPAAIHVWPLSGPKPARVTNGNWG